MNLKTQHFKSQGDQTVLNRLVAKSFETRQLALHKNAAPQFDPNISRMALEHSISNTISIKIVMKDYVIPLTSIIDEPQISKTKISDLRLLMKSKLTNEQIDQQLNDLRNEWERDI